jgi:hypothetical protein
LKRLIIISLAFMAACSDIQIQDDPEEPLLAEAFGNKLYLSDAAGFVPINVVGDDSAAFMENYVNKWVQQQILLHNAKENLTQQEQDFNRQMEEYRNSLLLYTYERKLVSMNLDTLVSEDEIEKYYLENHEQFELKSNIVKFDYVKLPIKSRQIKEFRGMLKPGSERDPQTLLDQCQKYSTDYWLADEWTLLMDLLENIPLSPDNEENFLRRTTFTETEDEEHVYMLRINDFRTIDSIPPLAFERQNIRNIIINSRKLDLLDKLRQKDIDEAIANKEAVIYKDPLIQ